MFNNTPETVQTSLNLLEWHPDGWKELWDAAHSPNYVQHVIDEIESCNEQPAVSMDCEDFALYAAHSIGNGYTTRVLTVSWSTGRWPWNIKGHAVCLYKDREDLYGHIGNWGLHHGYKTVEDAVNSILAGVDKSDNLIGWKLFYPPDLYMKR